MRSRYTAYALRRDDYVLSTWDATTRPARLNVDQRLRWTGLRVTGHRTTGPDTATVSFVATYTDGAGRHGQIREASRFSRAEGRWSYRDGDVA